ncbi:MAG TPA: hypothetical protein VEI02_02830, partial [Planctomycetota bacterium]|nr:hypothetical protein [Planctomycetota bacterium]
MIRRLDRTPFLASTPFERRFAIAWALGEAAGSTLVLGAPPPYVLAALAASASGVTFVAPP